MEKTYVIKVKEVHNSHMRIIASDPADAFGVVMDGGGEKVGLEYVESLDPTEWEVYEEVEHSDGRIELKEINRES
jgi:hypothetical protein